MIRLNKAGTDGCAGLFNAAGFTGNRRQGGIRPGLRIEGPEWVQLYMSISRTDAFTELGAKG